MPTTTAIKMTAEEFFDWSQRPENRSRDCELFRGEIVDVPSPGFSHGLIAALVAHILLTYAFKRGQGNVTANDTGLVISDETVLGPDIMYFGESTPLRDATRRHVRDIPLLCVEVISPSNHMTDMMQKIHMYHRRGVRLVWLIDPDRRSVHVFRSDELPKLLDDTETLTGNGILPDFSCPVADLFRLPGTA